MAAHSGPGLVLMTNDYSYITNIAIFQITFVGTIRDITEASTSISYKIDDYTGPPIGVRKFIQEGEVSRSLIL